MSARSAGNAECEIAIIGIACRLPGGVDSPASFWELLRNGQDAISDEPPARFDADRYFHPNPARRRLYTRSGGFLEQVEQFDPAFFGISPREASQIDPQQRLALELAWEALEDAAIVPGRLAGSATGVYIGVSTSDYGQAVRRNARSSTAYSNAGSALSIVPNRVSHFLDLHGPSVAVDTACSSSLVAVHDAVESLKRRETDLALAGGVNILLDPAISLGFCRASMLSPTGRCHTFDASADGYVRAEGGGLVALKRMDDAIADGDPIYASVLATGVNSDGHTTGLALPRQATQEALLRQVYRSAGVDPLDVTYIEAHGTGTPVGDPIECAAIGAEIGQGRQAPCRIGSVKTNVGHLETAAGITGLIKVALSLRKRELPRSLHFSNPNPQIDFDALKLSVVREHEQLAGPESLVMGVNSFGFGGTNAHAVLREAPSTGSQQNRTPVAPVSFLSVSARSQGALNTLAERYAELLSDEASPSLEEVSLATATQRTHHPHRLAIVADSKARASSALRNAAQGEADDSVVCGVASTSRPQVVFAFSGNGSQWHGMARELLQDDLAFRREVERIDSALQAHLSWSVLEELESDESHLHLTEYAQPLLFAIQVAVVRRLGRAGLKPDAVLGHSVGEVAAAWACGALSIREAARLIVERSDAQGTTAGCGKMAALGVSAERANELIRKYQEKLVVAGINSPTSTTIAGEGPALDRFGERVAADDIFFRKLDLDYAFHTHFMDPLESRILLNLKGLTAQPSKIPFFSTVTGSQLPGDRLDSRYWWENIRQPVRFGEAVQAAALWGGNVFLEIGPHPILQRYLRSCFDADRREAKALQTLSRQDHSPDTIQRVLARSYVAGCDVALQYTTGLDASSEIKLPTYPWERQRFWHSDPSSDDRLRHPLLGRRRSSAETSWSGEIDPEWPAWLADHVVKGTVLFPIAGYAELAFAAAREIGSSEFAVENLEVHRPLALKTDSSARTQFEFNAEDGAFRVSVRGADDETLHYASGQLTLTSHSSTSAPLSVETIASRLPKRPSAQKHYQDCAHLGLEYGPAFQGITQLWAGDGECLSQIEVPDCIEDGVEGYVVHPALLDACFQTVIAGLLSEPKTGASMYLPVHIARLRLLSDLPVGPFYCHVHSMTAHAETVTADLTLMDKSGDPILQVEGLTCRRSESERLTARFHEARAIPSHPIGQQARNLPEIELRREAFISTRTRDHMNHWSKRYYRGFRPEMDELVARFIEQAVRSLVGEKLDFDVAALVEEGFLSETQRQFFSSLLPVLIEERVLTSTGRESYRLSESPNFEPPELLWRRLIHDYPDFLAELQLVRRSGDALPEVLSGRTDPLHVLFGDHSIEAAEHLFESGRSAQICNEIAADAIRDIVRQWPGDRIIRVLEVGGGTGGLTSTILELFPTDQTDYLFTDISKMMVDRARKKFRHSPHIRFAQLDLEADAAEDDDLEQFDIVIGANVVHATRDLREALASIRRRLTPGGLQLLIEPHDARSANLTWGVLEGWWRFADDPLRSHSALLDPQGWQSLLEEEGYAEVIVQSDSEENPPLQSVLLARTAAEEADCVATPSSASTPVGTWACFVDPEPEAWAALLLERIAESGGQVYRVEPGPAYARSTSGQFVVPADDAQALGDLCQTLVREAHGRLNILHLWDMAGPADDSERMLAQSERCLRIALLAQALAKTEALAETRLWVATSDAMPTPGNAGPTHPEQASVWGLVRTLMNEEPRFECKLLDVGPIDAAAETADAILAELTDAGQETEVLLRRGSRYRNRIQSTNLTPPTHGTPDLPADAFALHQARPGRISEVSLQPTEIQQPRANEVCVRVKAAGLNFRDVLIALGMIPSTEWSQSAGESPAKTEAPGMGFEFAGEVVAVGPGVEAVSVGDSVCGLAPASFRSHLTVSSDTVWRTPPSLDPCSAATLPIAFLTAWYGLKHLARVQPGERVLIHSATGGVGLAALQCARSLGATVIATAGSVEKRAFLRSLGVKHVFDSRSTAFATDILNVTNSEGVDVVLNSLAGQAIPRGLSILREGGRFLELGQRDFLANSRLGLRPFRNNLAFFGIELGRIAHSTPELISTLWNEVSGRIESRNLHPLPYRVFPVSRTRDALRHMQRAHHIGKVVLDFDTEPLLPRTVGTDPIRLNPDGTYLVTGGLDGFGWATAEWLASRGARHLTLVGRRGRKTPGLQERLHALEVAGVTVEVVAADVSDASQVRKLFDGIRSSGPPLRGVFHAAMVLDDVPTLRMEAKNWEAAFHPKAHGAWNLHRETADMPLDFFVLYSSVAAAFGSPGQANYSAGNLYLESLAHHRRALGLAAHAIAWGPIADAGFLSRHPELRDRIAERWGSNPIRTRDAFDLLERVLQSGNSVVGITLDWNQLKHSFQRLSTLPLFERLGDTHPSMRTSRGVQLSAELAEMSHEQRLERIAAHIAELAADTLGMSAEHVQHQVPLTDLGMDSLMIVELQTEIADTLGITLPTPELGDEPRVQSLAMQVAERLGSDATATRPRPSE